MTGTVNDALWHLAGLRGVAANPSTPEPVLVGLAERENLAAALLNRERLPPAALPLGRIRQLVAAPDLFMREAAAGNPALPLADIERIIGSASGGPS
jgi:hypothetical protein